MFERMSWHLIIIDSCGSVAEWSKALDLGSSLFGGVGSNPTTAKTSQKSFDDDIYVKTLCKTSAWFSVESETQRPLCYLCHAPR